MANVEPLLVTPINLSRLVELFRVTSTSSLRLLLRPLIDILGKSDEISRHLGASGLFIRCLLRRIEETADAFLLRYYLGLLQLLHQHHSDPRSLVLNFGVYEKLRRLAEGTKAAQQVVVYEKVKLLLRDIQATTFS